MVSLFRFISIVALNAGGKHQRPLRLCTGSPHCTKIDLPIRNKSPAWPLQWSCSCTCCQGLGLHGSIAVCTGEITFYTRPSSSEARGFFREHRGAPFKGPSND
ncbi:hypothetical protein MRX96_031163 [Rhipicephalus microplus]